MISLEVEIGTTDKLPTGESGVFGFVFLTDGGVAVFHHCHDFQTGRFCAIDVEVEPATDGIVGIGVARRLSLESLDIAVFADVDGIVARGKLETGHGLDVICDGVGGQHDKTEHIVGVLVVALECPKPFNGNAEFTLLTDVVGGQNVFVLGTDESTASTGQRLVRIGKAVNPVNVETPLVQKDLVKTIGEFHRGEAIFPCTPDLFIGVACSRPDADVVAEFVLFGVVGSPEPPDGVKEDSRFDDGEFRHFEGTG